MSKVEDVANQLVASMKLPLLNLLSNWNEIGIYGDIEKERINVVIHHVSNLLDEMVREEENLKAKLLRSIDTCSEEISAVSKELHLPKWDPDDSLSILQMEKELRTMVDSLTKEKHSRLKKLKQMKDLDQRLCDALCMTPYYIPTGTTPSNEQLDALKTHITSLEEEKDRRKNIFLSTKKCIAKLMEDLDKKPQNDFERDVLNDSDETFVLSNDNLKLMKSLCDQLEEEQNKNFAAAIELRDRLNRLWERLEIPVEERAEFNSSFIGFKPATLKALKGEIRKLDQLKLANIAIFVETLRKEIISLWDKCYIAENERKKFVEFYDEEMSELLMERHEHEQNRLKLYYEENKEMLEKVEKRNVLWNEFIAFEKKSNDPSRFFSRGYNSLKEEKARKKLMKELPKIEDEVKTAIEEWETRNHRDFRLEGERFADYIQRQWVEFNEDKDKQKNQRHQNKVKQLETEMAYGSVPTTTPAKRKFATPNKTPVKVRKVDDKSHTSKSNTMSYFGQTNASLFPSVSKITTPKKSGHTSIANRTRRALTDCNNTHTLFSHTTVSSQQDAQTTAPSLATVGQYADFSKGLNQNARPNCRSSVLPPKSPGKFI